MRSCSKMKTGVLQNVQFHWWDYAQSWYEISLNALLGLQSEWIIEHIWVTNCNVTFLKKLEKELQENKRIIEGYINPLAKERFQESNIVYYLDYSWFTALFWYLKRYWKYRKSPRPEMKKWSEEKLDFAFMKTILTRAERNEIENEVQGFDSKILRFRSRKELESHIYELRKSIT